MVAGGAGMVVGGASMLAGAITLPTIWRSPGSDTTLPIGLELINLAALNKTELKKTVKTEKRAVKEDKKTEEENHSMIDRLAKENSTYDKKCRKFESCCNIYRDRTRRNNGTIAEATQEIQSLQLKMNHSEVRGNTAAKLINGQLTPFQHCDPKRVLQVFGLTCDEAWKKVSLETLSNYVTAANTLGLHHNTGIYHCKASY